MAESIHSATTESAQRPVTLEELAGVVRMAAGWQHTLGIRAGGTHARFANRGPETDITLDLTALDQVIDYAPVDLTLAVEPGLTLAAIDALLAAQGQRLALDMPRREQATIGGAFAAGLSGPRRLRYGALKDMVIGAEVVNARGEIAKSGGMVVKNVSGYEVARLHYGAHGAFGIVARLNLKVLPAVEARLEARIDFESPAEAARAGAGVLVSSLDPAAVYATRNGESGWALHVQIEGSRAFAQAQGQRVLDLFPEGRERELVPLDGASTPDFDAIVDLTDAGRSVARLSVPASRQEALLERLDALNAGGVLADMGSGLIYLRFGQDASSLPTIDSLGVPVTWLAPPATAVDGLDVFGPMDASGLEVIRRLKAQYDPDGMFNPGRFIAFL